MNKDDIQRRKISVNELDNFNGYNSILCSHMSLMYELSNDTGDIDDVVFEERNKPINK